MWPAERNPKNSSDATKGTHSQDRNCLCPLKVFHPSSWFVSGINTLFCSTDIRCKNGDLSAMGVSGLKDLSAGSGESLSPSANQCGPPSETKTRAQGAGASAASDF